MLQLVRMQKDWGKFEDGEHMYMFDCYYSNLTKKFDMLSKNYCSREFIQTL